MAELALTDLFPGATQTSTSITIPKAALPTLTPMGDNKTEILIAAIAIRLSQVFTQAARDADPDRSIVVEQGAPRIDRVFSATGEETQYLARELAIQFFEPYTPQPWDADAY